MIASVTTMAAIITLNPFISFKTLNPFLSFHLRAMQLLWRLIKKRDVVQHCGSGGVVRQARKCPKGG